MRCAPSAELPSPELKFFAAACFFSYNSCLRDLVAFLERVDRDCLCSIFVLRLAWCCLVAFLFDRIFGGGFLSVVEACFILG